jgi:hypothetical protein
VADLVEGHPRRLSRVASRLGHLLGIVQHGDVEVEDHEVVVVADALDPPDQVVAHGLEAGFLGDLPHHGLGEGLASLDPTARHAPLPCRRAVSPPDEEQAVVDHGDGSDAHLRLHVGRLIPG